MGEIPSDEWTWINAAANRFERAWKEGERPRIKDFLAGAEGARAVGLLEELLRVELELRRRAGEAPTAEEYCGRFPDNAEMVDAIFEPDLGHLAGPGPHPDATSTSPITPSRETEGGDPAAPGARVRYFGDYE